MLLRNYEGKCVDKKLSKTRSSGGLSLGRKEVPNLFEGSGIYRPRLSLLLFLSLVD